ncbi:MAG: exodeoxyribonuclease III [bacterium]
MKIISWNTNGLRATAKQGNLMPLFKKYDPDVLCLQETKCEAIQLPEEVRNIPGYYSYFSHSMERKGYSGVAIYTRIKPQEVFYGIGVKKLDTEGRIVGIKLTLNKKSGKEKYTIITGYFPNGGAGPHRLKYKLEFYDAFLKFILKLRKNGENVIFCGDVNTAHNAIDLARPKANEENTGFLPIERAWISKVIKNNFIDTFRKFYPEKVGAYTYWDQKTRSRERNTGWRLDYFFADSKIKIKNADMLSDYLGSDHCPIWLEI